MIYWHQENCTPIVHVKYRESFMGRRKASVGVLRPVMVQTAASTFPGSHAIVPTCLLIT